MSKREEERRQFRREKCFREIFYSRVGSGLENLGFAYDCSSNGLCVVSPDRIRENDKVVIHKGCAAEQPVEAEIKWVTRIEGNIYKAGLSFGAPLSCRYLLRFNGKGCGKSH